jgi:hypothetical protein
LEAYRNPQRPDDKASLRDAFKFDRPLFDRAINPYRETQERKREKANNWRAENMSRAESRSAPMLKKRLMQSTMKQWKR